ncbi:hypothetical protein ENC09_10920 [Shigella flexneri]|nr:hypothetical protein [Shigella flexneri]EFX5622219.1 hypothetical protein [Shigella flexneri]EFX7710733.1 hypothetical protein [Shigella flexneri]MMW94867.1 hypothetical protein [Shigella flexneri]
MLLIFIGSLLFRMSTMNCYNITIPYGRIPVAFLRSVKSRRGIFCRGGLLIKGHGLNKPQKSTAGWLVARVSLMLAYAKTWHLKE